MIGVISTFFSPGQKPADTVIVGIERVYSALNVGKPVFSQKISGSFQSINAHTNNERHVYTSPEKATSSIIRYFNFSDEEKPDYFLWKSNKIKINHKLDPLTIKTYKVKARASYVVFIGKAESASGSGVHVTYFIVSKLDKSGRVDRTYEFESRFGNIHTLIKLESQSELCYYKIKNGDKMGTFNVTVNKAPVDTPAVPGMAVLKYNNNDKFQIMTNDIKLSEH